MPAVPKLQNATRVTLLDFVHLMGLALWDEAEGGLVGFTEAKRLENSRSFT
jgi:hypothetical protein